MTNVQRKKNLRCDINVWSLCMWFKCMIDWIILDFNIDSFSKTIDSCLMTLCWQTYSAACRAMYLLIYTDLHYLMISQLLHRSTPSMKTMILCIYLGINWKSESLLQESFDRYYILLRGYSWSFSVDHQTPLILWAMTGNSPWRMFRSVLTHRIWLYRSSLLFPILNVLPWVGIRRV